MAVDIADKITGDGVHILLRNDIADGQVEMGPLVCEKPVTGDTRYLKNVTSIPQVCSDKSCGEQTKRMLQSEVIGVQVDSDISLSDTVYRD